MKLELKGCGNTGGDLLAPNKKYVVSSSGAIKVTRHTYAGVEPFVVFVRGGDYVELAASKVKTMLTIESREGSMAFTVYVSEN